MAICMVCIPTIVQLSVIQAATESPIDSEFLDLSNIKPITAQVGWGSVAYDKNLSGNPISLFVDGAKKVFKKGIVAHAASTIIYDLQSYNYDFFTCYIGIDSSQGNKGSVIFKVFVSADNKSWTQQYVSPQALTGNSNAAKISVDITGYRYLKLYADANGANGNDHAVYGNPKLIKADYLEPEEKLISELDTKIKEHGINEDLSAIELTLLQRTFVKKVGYESLKELCKTDKKYEDTINWLANDLDTLREYLTSGVPDEGTYLDSLKILSELYNKHSSDLAIKTVNSVSGIIDGEVYKRMMLALSLTHTRDIAFWADTSQKSDPVVRYEIYKNLRSKGFIENKIFDKIPVITMRLTFNSMFSDPQIAWLNNFALEKKAANSSNPKFDYLNEYNYLPYRDDYNYAEAQYYAPENYDKWNAKYKLAEYKIPYVTGKPQLWIIFEEGGVCGALSKTGTNLKTSRGIPALVLSQPGHAAYMYYNQDNAGLGAWALGNNIDGWAYSGWTWEGNHPTKWGTESWVIAYPASFTLLSQAAINDISNYAKAEEYLFLADVYKDDKDKLESIYNLALSKQAINYNAWKELVKIYKTDTTKTDTDRYELAERIATALTFYPNPMYSLLKQLDLSITDDQIIAKSVVLKDSALKRAAKATAKDTLQFSECQQLAKKLLGEMDLTIATFSFDGENANKIVLSNKFAGSSTRLKYSLDGGTTWNDTDSKEVLLTSEQIKSITATNDIHIGLVGSPSTQVIDIAHAPTPTGLYINDFENVIFGNTTTFEWSYEEITWTKFIDATPNLEGNKTLYVRTIANGTLLASTSIAYNFTEVLNLSKQYIPNTELSIADSSSVNSENEKATNVIDGNKFTMWRTTPVGVDTERHITIKLSAPKYISALQYVPAQRNGNIYNSKVLTSLDGITFTEVAALNLYGQMNHPDYGKCDSNNMLPKNLVFNKAVLATYVKFVAIKTHQDYASVAILNLFEAVTASIDSSSGTLNLNENAGFNNNDLNIKITKNSNVINAIKIEDKTYFLNNPEDLTALSNIMKLEPTEDGYNITLLKSWMTLLEEKDYSITFIADNNYELLYNLHIIDTNGNTGGDPTPPTDGSGGNPSNANSSGYLYIKIAGVITGIAIVVISIVFIVLKLRKIYIAK